MLITCDNKGCLKTTDAQLDTKTYDVICLECEQPINNISEAMKRVLKSSGQIVRASEKKSFTMACMNCYANREVLLDDNDNTICSVCHNPITIHAAMRLAMEETGTKLRRITAEEKKADEKQPEVKSSAKKRTRKKTTSK